MRESAHTDITGARMRAVSPFVTRFCTWVMSFVQRVMSDSVENTPTSPGVNALTLENVRVRSLLAREDDV